MEDPTEESSVYFVRCLKCNGIVKCSSLDTEVLLDHIRIHHPEIEQIKSAEPKKEFSNEQLVSQSNSIDDGITKPKQSDTSENNVPEANGCSCNNGSETKIIYTRRYKIKTPNTCASHYPNRNHLYKASIEKWQPCNGTIYCPKCNSYRRPIVQTRADRFKHNSCSACCLLDCWPFCFVPCLFPGQNMEYLHCGNCKTFLGVYDRDYNCIKPNRQFVNSRECHKAKEYKRTETKTNNPYTCETYENFKKATGFKEQKCQKAQALSSKYVSQNDSNSYKQDRSRRNSETDKDKDEDEERIPVVTIDGKQVSPKHVKRLTKYSKWAGVDINSLTEDDAQDKKK